MHDANFLLERQSKHLQLQTHCGILAEKTAGDCLLIVPWACCTGFGPLR